MHAAPAFRRCSVQGRNEESHDDDDAAARDLGDPRVLPHEPDPDLLRLADGVQPARHRPLGPQPLLRQLLRLVRGHAPARVRAAGAAVPRVRVDGGHLQRAARATARSTRRSPAAARAARPCSSCSTRRPRRSPRRPGLEVALPSAELRHRLDSKIVTTQLANDAGVPSAPNTLGHATSYEELLALADEAGLGHDLVVQTPYGDSGKTTFFIKSQRRLGRERRRARRPRSSR